MVGAGRAYVSVPSSFAVEVDPLPFGPGEVVLVLAARSADEALISRLRVLVAEGHRLALDDCAAEVPPAQLVRLASAVRLDVTAEGMGRIAERVDRLRPLGHELLAANVETQEQFEACRALGFDAYQGWFLARPRWRAGSRRFAKRSCSSASAPSATGR